MRSSATLAVCDNEALEAIMCSDKGGELEQKSNSAQFDDSANAEDNKNNSLIRNVTTTLRKNSSDAGDSSSSLIPDQNISCSASLGQENDHVSEEACINLMNAISKKSAEERQKSEEERSDDSGIGKNFRAAIEAPLLTEYVVTNPTTIGVEAHEESSYKISGHKDRFGTNSWRCGPKKTHDSVLSPGCPRASCTPSQTENNFVNSKPEHSVHGISGEQIESLSQFRSVAKSISRTESAPAFEEPKLAENLHETLQPTELVDAVSEQLNSVNDPANEEEAGLFGKMYTAVSPEQRILLKTYAGTTGGYYPLRMTAGSCGSDPALENQQVQRSNHPFVYLVEEYSNALHQRYTASKSHIEDSIAVESLDIEIPAQLDHLESTQNGLGVDGNEVNLGRLTRLRRGKVFAPGVNFGCDCYACKKDLLHVPCAMYTVEENASFVMFGCVTEVGRRGVVLDGRIHEDGKRWASGFEMRKGGRGRSRGMGGKRTGFRGDGHRGGRGGGSGTVAHARAQI